MGLFNRKNTGDGDDGEAKKKGNWRRPANTAFKQQRLKAWQPILTPKTVLPTLFIIGLIFGPIGGLLVWGSGLVSEMSFDYSDCDTLPPQSSLSLAQQNLVELPSDKYTYRLSADNANAPINTKPKYAFVEVNATDPAQKIRQCVVQFELPVDLKRRVFFYYKLTNFFQNHRRYVKSLDSDQLRGKRMTPDTLDKGDCKPLASINGKAIYPCGLIANSVFNDTFTNPELLNEIEGVPKTYDFSNQDIAWPGEKKKYAKTPIGGEGYQSVDEIVPPPNWMDRYPNGYTDDNIPDLEADEHFQNWMRTAGLPTFTKLYGRGPEKQTMFKGEYEIVIGMNFPVRPYKGTKSFVISTVSWIGGKNPFLGWAYVATAGLFVLLAVMGTARHLIKPRRLGDMSLLSWNR